MRCCFSALAFFIFLMARIMLSLHSLQHGRRLPADQAGLHRHRRLAERHFLRHVYISIWVLLAGFTQFSKTLRKRIRPTLHRTPRLISMRSTSYLSPPAGLMMGFYANGGIPSKIAFCPARDRLDHLYRDRRQKERKRAITIAHRDLMIRSYALTLSALTLRAWKWSINNSVELSADGRLPRRRLARLGPEYPVCGIPHLTIQIWRKGSSLNLSGMLWDSARHMHCSNPQAKVVSVTNRL